MEELGPVHRYAAGALFSLALNQAQIHRQGMIPDMFSTVEEDGPEFPTLSEDEGVIPWSSEQCGLLRHILKYLEIDPQAWPGIEVTAAVPDAKHHIGPQLFFGSTSGTKSSDSEKELLSSLTRLGLSPRLSGWTKKIHSALSKLGIPAQISGPTVKLIDLGFQSTLSTFGLPSQLDFSTADIMSLISTLGLSPRSSLPATPTAEFNPCLPVEPRNQDFDKYGIHDHLPFFDAFACHHGHEDGKKFALAAPGARQCQSVSPSYPTEKDLEFLISNIRLSRQQRAMLYLPINFHPSAVHDQVNKFIRILQEQDADSGSAASSTSLSESTKTSARPEKAVATFAKAVDAMALSLEEFATTDPSERNQTFEETFAAHAKAEQGAASSHSSARRWASMKKPLINKQSSESKESAKESSENEDQKDIARQTLTKQRKVAVMYELLTACVADTPEEKAGKSVLNAGYDARQRAALRLLALWLDLDWEKVAAIELMVAYMAIAAEKEKAEKATHQAEEENQGWAKWKRGGIISAAAITGGALLAVTGGLAAPAIAAGLSALGPTVIGAGGLATVMGSAAGSAAVAASFGAAGAGLAGTKMARRTGGVDEFLFLPIGDNHQQGVRQMAVAHCWQMIPLSSFVTLVASSSNQRNSSDSGSCTSRSGCKSGGLIAGAGAGVLGESVSVGITVSVAERLAVGIMISGIVYDADDFKKPWEGPDWDLERWGTVIAYMSPVGGNAYGMSFTEGIGRCDCLLSVAVTLINERYAVRWETKQLMAVSTAIEDWLASSAARELFKAGAMMTVLAGLVTALAWPAALLSATDWIDGKWALAVDRSDKAGIILAKTLLQGTQGNRPVTLVGNSLGARVVFSCLEHLAKQGNSASIVERVVLLGAPITLDQRRWKAARKVVSGRFINAYSTNDWILGIIYRASFVTQGLAGLQKVEIPGIENVDVTELISGHNQYLGKSNEILQALDIDSFYPVYPSKLHPAPEFPNREPVNLLT